MKKIIFRPSLADNHIFVTPPKPANFYKAEWYEKISAFYNEEQIYGEGHFDNLTIKHCVPFRDSLFAGYIQESWQDIHFSINEDNGMINYRFPSAPEIINHREHSTLPMGEEYHPAEFVIKMPWAAETPAGWSILVTQPFNRPELPFYVPSAIIDSDKLTNTTGDANIPFYLRKDATGLIKAGTPMYQMIPFKRDSWKSEIAEFDGDLHKKTWAVTKQHFWGGYKKHFWQKKTYK